MQEIRKRNGKLLNEEIINFWQKSENPVRIDDCHFSDKLLSRQAKYSQKMELSIKKKKVRSLTSGRRFGAYGHMQIYIWIRLKSSI